MLTDRQTEERTHGRPAINHDTTLKVGRSKKSFVPFRSAKYQFTGVISILRNGTEQKKKDGISLEDVDLLYIGSLHFDFYANK